MTLDTSAMPQLWSCVETSFGIISACIPSLTPLYTILFGKPSSSTPHSSPQRSQYRDHRARAADIDRITALDESKYPSQSLELMLRNHNVVDRSVVLRDGKDIEDKTPGIIVTRQIDQTSENTSSQPSEREGFGITADMRTSNYSQEW